MKPLQGGNCKTCRIRRTCYTVCNAARAREQRLKAAFEKRNRLVKKYVLLMMDQNNESFRE